MSRSWRRPLSLGDTRTAVSRSKLIMWNEPAGATLVLALLASVHAAMLGRAVHVGWSSARAQVDGD